MPPLIRFVQPSSGSSNTLWFGCWVLCSVLLKRAIKQHLLGVLANTLTPAGLMQSLRGATLLDPLITAVCSTHSGKICCTSFSRVPLLLCTERLMLAESGPEWRKRFSELL